MTGSLAIGFHEGSRSEYLAQFVFSSFGTAVPVPHQEDAGLDIYCTLMDQVGQRAWPRAYYSVQVKSTMAPWVFGNPESVRWIIEHPLPIFLCIVQKAEARILIYHTTPRFAVWALPTQPHRLELIPGTETKAHTVNWAGDAADTFNLKAPILNFTIQQVLDRNFRGHVADVLNFWIEYDMDNLLRIKCGIHHFRVPHDYETNTIVAAGPGSPQRADGAYCNTLLSQGRYGECCDLCDGTAAIIPGGLVGALAFRSPQPAPSRETEQPFRNAAPNVPVSGLRFVAQDGEG
jgi:hypothetical protein